MKNIKGTLGLLDMFFPGHEDDFTFVEGCEALDEKKNPLSKKERLAAYKRSLEHFHCLQRNYPAWWNHMPQLEIDNRYCGSSLYNQVLSIYRQRIDSMPSEVAEMNMSLYDEARDSKNAPKVEAMSLFMTRMLRQLHLGMVPAARLAS